VAEEWENKGDRIACSRLQQFQLAGQFFLRHSVLIGQECASSEYPQVALYVFSTMNVFYSEHNCSELRVVAQITLLLCFRWGPAFTAGLRYPENMTKVFRCSPQPR